MSYRTCTHQLHHTTCCDRPCAWTLASKRRCCAGCFAGFAAYWLRDDERTTPFPQPIDVMLKANMVVQRTHASIPGIWIQETPTELSIIATPAFLPPVSRQC